MSETSLQPGARVGNYILQERIGEGAFAQVWKAEHHERPGRIVAVKIAVEEDFRRALSREGQLPDIDHPNVVPILDSDTRFAATPYIVMPYLPGGSLAELIAKHPHGLPEDRVESLLQDILAGLAAAHDQGIVHRDIKPQNVLLDESGRALISDFGLSLLGSQVDGTRSIMQSASLSLEQNRTLAGTLAYMAPEVLNGEPATMSSDVYSVGVVLFEMLVGRRPGGLEFPGERRPDLRAAGVWDESYRIACGPADQRHADAKVMRDALRSVRQRVTLPPVVRVHPEQVLPIRISVPASIVVPRETVEGPPTPKQAFSPMTREQAKAGQAAAAEHFKLPSTVSLDFGGGVMMELVLIPPGSFMMGSKDIDHEKPPHRVTIGEPFYMSKHQVTQTQWQAVMGNSPSAFKGDGNLPVENVSWVECQDFCQALTGRLHNAGGPAHGLVVRLPSEAMWEYACRAGTTTPYCFGDDEKQLGLYAWYSENSSDKTHPVGSKLPNAWGLYDMHGNVGEWCQDWHGPHGEGVLMDPAGAGSGDGRVLRGGSWNICAGDCRSTSRDEDWPEAHNDDIGFRIAAGTQ